MAPLTATPQAATGTAGRRAVFAICAVVIAATVVLNQSAVHWRDNVVDSHLFAYHGWCVAQGARPYLDIWDNKPPGIWWVNAAGFLIFGEGVGGELFICTVAMAIALVAFAGIARAAYNPSVTLVATVTGCVLLSHLIFEGGGNRTETFVVACESVAVLAYLRWLRGNRVKWLIVAGMAAGAALLFKQSGLAAAAAIGVHLAWTTLRVGGARRRGVPEGGGPAGRKRILARFGPICAFVAGFVAFPLCAVAVLAAQGALGQAWYAVGRFNRAYFEIDDATYTRIDRALLIFREVLAPLVWVFVAAAGGLVWAAIRYYRKRVGVGEAGALDAHGEGGSPGEGGAGGRPGGRGAGEAGALACARGSDCDARVAGGTYVGVFWLWFAFAAYLACVGPGRRGHHFMPALPPLGLLALYPVHLLAGGSGLWRRIVAQPTIAAALVLYLYALLLLAVGNAAETGRCWQQKPHWWSLAYAETPGYQLQAAEIRRLTRPDEPIYVWGWSPGTYRYAYRRAASRYATFEKVGQLGERGRFILDRAKQDLQRNPPRVMVFSPADLAGVLGPRGGEFGDWLAAHYEDRGVVGGMNMLTRK